MTATTRNDEKRDYCAVNSAKYPPISFTIRVEIEAPETLTGPFMALVNAVRGVSLGFSGDGDNLSTVAKCSEFHENPADVPGVDPVESTDSTFSGQVVDFPENPVASIPKEVDTVNAPQSTPADGLTPPASSNAALMEARQVPAADAAPMEARQVVSSEETSNGEITLMEVTRLITDIRNEFGEAFTPERAKQFTEEIHKRSGVKYPPKTPGECKQMHAALMAMRRVLRFNRGVQRGPHGGAANE